MKVSTVNFIKNESLALGVFLKKLRSFFECIIYKTPLDDLGTETKKRTETNERERSIDCTHGS